MFSQSFSESVLDYLDFDDPASKWYRVEGGTQQLISAMIDKISVQPTLNARVTSILHDYQNTKDDDNITVTTSDGKRRQYNAVFNTTTLGSLQRVDMCGLPLDDNDVGTAQWTAI